MFKYLVAGWAALGKFFTDRLEFVGRIGFPWFASFCAWLIEGASIGAGDEKTAYYDRASHTFFVSSSKDVPLSEEETIENLWVIRAIIAILGSFLAGLLAGLGVMMNTIWTIPMFLIAMLALLAVLPALDDGFSVEAIS